MNRPTIQPQAVLMAAAHILTKTEHTGSGSDIMDRGTYRTARLREVASLAWDLARAVEQIAPEPEPLEITGSGLICERCCTFTPMNPGAVGEAIRQGWKHKCGELMKPNR